jgi:hypothetical protein
MHKEVQKAPLARSLLLSGQGVKMVQFVLRRLG